VDSLCASLCSLTHRLRTDTGGSRRVATTGYVRLLHNREHDHHDGRNHYNHRRNDHHNDYHREADYNGYYHNHHGDADHNYGNDFGARHDSGIHYLYY